MFVPVYHEHVTVDVVDAAAGADVGTRRRRVGATSATTPTPFVFKVTVKPMVSPDTVLPSLMFPIALSLFRMCLSISLEMLATPVFTGAMTSAATIKLPAGPFDTTRETLSNGTLKSSDNSSLRLNNILKCNVPSATILS
jgi:hypothetical protein